MRSWQSHTKAILLVAIGILAVAGCGGDTNDTSQGPNEEVLVRRAAVAWYSAIARADGARACALMAPAFRKELAEDGPAFTVSQDGRLVRNPRSCSARISAGSEETIVGSGIAAGVNAADVTTVDVLDDHATTVAKLGKGSHVLSLAKVRGRWLINGARRP